MLIFRKKSNVYTAFENDNEAMDKYEILREGPWFACFKNKYWFLGTQPSLDQAKARCELEVRRAEYMTKNPEKEEWRKKIAKNCVAIGVKIFYNGDVEPLGCSERVLQAYRAYIREHSLPHLKAKELPVAKTKSTTTAAPAAAAATPANATTEATTKPAKDRVSLTDEEIDQAVAGQLKPRDTKGAVDQPGLVEKDEKGRPKGRPLGVLTGLPILGSWCYAFQENAKPASAVGAAAKGLLGRKPDASITAFMEADFPGRATPAFKHPQGCRNDYNNGVFTRLKIPASMSVPYNEKGEQVEPTKRGQKEAAAATAPAATTAAPAAATPAATGKKKGAATAKA